MNETKPQIPDAKPQSRPQFEPIEVTGANALFLTNQALIAQLEALKGQANFYARMISQESEKSAALAKDNRALDEANRTLGERVTALEAEKRALEVRLQAKTNGTSVADAHAETTS